MRIGITVAALVGVSLVASVPKMAEAQEQCEECICDCPQGPPPPPLIDSFCASAEDGEVCCLSYDGRSVGTCYNNECWPLSTPISYCGSQQKVFGSFDYCYKANCCEMTQQDLDYLCEHETRLGKAVVCDPNPTPGAQTDMRECIDMEVEIECSWDEQPVTLNLLCCDRECIE